MSEYWSDNNPFFKVNKIEDLSIFINNYSSPCYIYSRKVIADQYNNLRNSLPEKFSIFYAQKSNPNPEILGLLNSLHAGCDTASLGEVKSALDAGFAPDRIMMTGPAKTEKELRFAIQSNLLSVNVESLQELMLIDKICSELGKKQKVLIRINPKFEAGEKNRIIGGMGVSKFGIDIDFIPEVFRQAKSLGNIEIKGIHIFNSSQILDWNRIYLNIKDVIDTAINFSKEHNLEFDLIDAGGGLGIPYSENENFLDTEKLGNNLQDLINNPKYKDFLLRKNIILEPGRFLSGLSGIYLTKVLYTKESCGKKILLTDGGIHHLIRPVLIGQNHPIINLSAALRGAEKSTEYIIAGPLCTSLDEFSGNAVLKEAIPGDILAILNTGAYGYTESMPLFLSHSPATEIFID
ncbi:MAG: hypothetical protein HY959_10990 [Ignavibacteriae bacterium]|nr:hypothetical protein [Ignavibacteriota bacterium]